VQHRSKERLAHVLWLGGSPCSGKSSIARLLASEGQLRTYHCDDEFPRHQQRITPQQQPTMDKWTTTAWNELWMQPPETLLAEAIAAYREHLAMVVDDLQALPGTAPILAEGTCLLPNEVHALLSHPRQAIWLVPTEEFQRAHYAKRGPWVQELVSQCEQPEQAFQNWMDRDVAFAKWVEQSTGELGLRVVTVDGKRTIADNVQLVARHFGL